MNQKEFEQLQKKISQLEQEVEKKRNELAMLEKLKDSVLGGKIITIPDGPDITKENINNVIRTKKKELIEARDRLTKLMSEQIKHLKEVHQNKQENIHEGRHKPLTPIQDAKKKAINQQKDDESYQKALLAFAEACVRLEEHAQILDLTIWEQLGGTQGEQWTAEDGIDHGFVLEIKKQIVKGVNLNNAEIAKEVKIHNNLLMRIDEKLSKINDMRTNNNQAKFSVATLVNSPKVKEMMEGIKKAEKNRKRSDKHIL